MNSALKWKLISGFLLVFVAGGLTGGFIAATTARYYFLAAGHHGVAAERMRERLQRELDLTPEQMKKISPIVDKATSQLEQVRMNTAGRVHQIFTEMHRQISAELTPEQQVKLERLRESHRRALRRFHHPEGPPPPPPM